MTDVKEIIDNQGIVEISHEDKRADRDLKHWVIKAIISTICVVFVASTGTLLYASIAQDKDFERGFIGEIFKGFFEVLKVVLG